MLINIICIIDDFFIGIQCVVVGGLLAGLLVERRRYGALGYWGILGLWWLEFELAVNL